MFYHIFKSKIIRNADIITRRVSFICIISFTSCSETSSLSDLDSDSEENQRCIPHCQSHLPGTGFQVFCNYDGNKTRKILAGHFTGLISPFGFSRTSLVYMLF